MAGGMNLTEIPIYSGAQQSLASWGEFFEASWRFGVIQSPVASQSSPVYGRIARKGHQVESLKKCC